MFALSAVLVTSLYAPTSVGISPATTSPVIKMASTASVSMGTADKADWDRIRFIVRLSVLGGTLQGGHPSLYLPLEDPGSGSSDDGTPASPSVIPGGTAALALRIPFFGGLSIVPETWAFFMPNTFKPEDRAIAAILGGASLDFTFLPGTERIFVGVGLDAGRVWIVQTDNDWQGLGIVPYGVAGIRAAVSSSVLVQSGVRVAWVIPVGAEGTVSGAIPTMSLEIGFEF